MEDSFSTGVAGRQGGDSGGNVSSGERQVELHWLACRSPPAVAGFLTGLRPLSVCGLGAGDPDLEATCFHCLLASSSSKLAMASGVFLHVALLSCLPPSLLRAFVIKLGTPR